MTTPTQRTLAALRSAGYIAGVVEYWQPSHAARGVVSAAEDWCRAGGDIGELTSAVDDLKKFGPGKRQDLFDFIDIIAIRDEILGVQCTSASGVSARVNKIILECQEEAQTWLKSGGRLEVWGWKKYSKPIDRRFWRPSIRHLRLASNGAISVEKDEGGLAAPEKVIKPTELPF